MMLTNERGYLNTYILNTLTGSWFTCEINIYIKEILKLVYLSIAYKYNFL